MSRVRKRPTRPARSSKDSKRTSAKPRSGRAPQAKSGNPRARRPKQAHFRLDSGVVLSAGLLLGLGAVMSYSTTAALALDQHLPPLFLKHIGALALGLGAAGVCLGIPLAGWRALAVPAWALAVLLLAMTAIFGVEVNGAQRWLPIPGTGFRFQPVELVKIATLIAVTAVVSVGDGRRELESRRAIVAAGLAALPIALLLRQPDLGNAVIIAVLSGLVIFAAGLPMRRLALPGLVGSAGLAAYVATNPYALRRVTGFLRPWDDPLGAGFQLVQSFAAFGNGGLFGAGMGASRQKLYYLPEGHTDFVLALVAEELGLLGVLFVLGAFASLWIAGTRIARSSSDRFGLLLALSMTSLLCIPSAVNAAVVMGLVPTKGLTLPFLSYGGTSLIASCAVLGILLGVGRNSAAKPAPPIAGGTMRALSWR